jgi:HK97 family phage prohead protease
MHELDGLTRDSVRALFSPEMRTVAVPMRDLEWRESGSGDGSRILTGYAAVCNQRTTLYDGTYYQLDEVIAAGAFDAVLSRNPDVHLNIGHDMSRAMARTGVQGIGGLQLTADPHGLRVYARLSGADPDVQALAAKMDLGIMDQMSFAFSVKAAGLKWESETDENGKETDLRTLVEIGQLYDVCVCAQGAYSTTEAALRSLALGAHVTSREVTSSGDGAQDGPAVSPASTDGAREAVARKKLALLAHVRSADTYEPVKDE